jgi:phage shock protein A
MLLKRITTLFRADTHAVIDALEHPHNQLKQSLREMNKEVEKLASALSEWQRKRDLINQEIQDLVDQHEKINHELDICFSAENEALIRSTLRRRLINEKSHHQASKQLKKTNDHITALQLQHAECQSQYEAILLKANAYLQTDQTRQGHCDISEDELEIALITEKQKRSSELENAHD